MPVLLQALKIQFQTLIDRLNTCVDTGVQDANALFQTLIDRLNTMLLFSIPWNGNKFQTLIDRLNTLHFENDQVFEGYFKPL